jgi:hypothetical protein
VADALRRKGIVGTRKEAFSRYLGKGRPAYVPPMGPTAKEAIETIRAAGGWAVLAHPGMVSRDLDVERWVAWGLEGLEVYYPAHSGPQIERLLGMAERFGLLVTGGSDFHGLETDHGELGCIPFPEEAFARIEGRLGLSGGA